MINRLPRWVWTGGAVLAFVAGFVNVVGLLGFQHEAVSHVTGTVSRIGVELAGGGGAAAVHLMAVVGAFFAGATLSGFLVRDATLVFGRRYGVALLLETAFLVAAIPLLQRQGFGGAYLLSVACGVQNAMATTFSGAVVRSTHLTGVITDLGILLGHRLRGMEVDGRHVRLFLAILLGFVTGGAAGSWAFGVAGYGSLWVPAVITGTLGGGYVVRRLLRSRRSRQGPAPGRDR